MRAHIFLSTRNKATRLPGKVLLDIKEKTVTDHLIDRLKSSRESSLIVLCTSTNSNDDPLVKIATNNGIEFFRGSEEDKLDRYLQAARKFQTDFILVVDGDDIFCDPGFIDLCVVRFKESNADYITARDVPVGTTPFCIKKEALEKVCMLKDQKNTEVWESCFTESGLFDVSYVDVETKLQRPDIRLTLDYQEDYELFKKIFDRFYQPRKTISLSEIIDFLDHNPDLLQANRRTQELFLENFKRMPKVTLKPENS